MYATAKQDLGVLLGTYSLLHDLASVYRYV
jgi:hypothetical protein